MITTALLYNFVALIILTHLGNLMPFWGRAIVQIGWLVAYIIAYISEENLRDKIKHLEDEVKKLKKGGE